MVDTQSSYDDRNIPIDRVGIRGLRYPITVLDKKNNYQNTTATINMYANLPHHFRGTHMSRFVEVFNEHYKDIQMKGFISMLKDVKLALEAESAFIEIEFPYFIEKSAPVTGQKSYMEYKCKYIGQTKGNHADFWVSIEVPVNTVCPCSKEISDYGAHNQRGMVRLTVKLGPFFWIEDLIELVENSASAGIFSLLKREDEKFITEHGYDNPRFVEDVAREVVLRVENFSDFPWFKVEAENMESIHNHNAYACIERCIKENAHGPK
ncbi:GTP cyclohydrolase FolE2 [Spirochaetia bacterium 38H-sp]|uniref:GTP cyclohydrolase FolE2 n=1 Tax=Rarispira pelagica TaxID=3141764 RepID=A0ABU9UB45_9SPIR